MKRIKVTQEHIARGKRADPTSCPIALAMTEACGKPMIVGYVTYYTAANAYSHGTYKPLPPEAQNFITAFDIYGGYVAVEPFEFDADC